MGGMDVTERGLPLEEAFRRTLTEAERAELDKYEAYRDPVLVWIPGEPPTQYEVLHDKYHQLRQPWQERFMKMLRSEELGATALEVPTTLSSRRTVVPTHLWDVLELDFDKSEASGAGLILVDVKVIATPHVSDVASSAASGNFPPQPISSPEERVRCYDEGRVLMIDGHMMLFGGDAQKSIISQLVEGYRQKKPTWGLGMLKKAGSDSKSIEKLFKDNPHWDLLSSYLVRKKGFYLLELKSL
jgi:hypothetical protein